MYIVFHTLPECAIREFMTIELSDIVKNALLPSASGKTVYFTLGSMLRGDDGVGPLIAERLSNCGKDVVVINASEVPESFLDHVVRKRPSKTVFIDAADFNGEAGEVRVLDPNTLHEPFRSTHRFPIKILAQIIEEDTGSDVCFIGIQIRHVSFGSPVDRRVEESADSIVEFVRENANGTTQ